MTDATGRAQDQGRRHRRQGKPSAATATLLADYQAAMRDELRALLVDIRGKVPDPGVVSLAPGETLEVVRPSLRDRAALWDLAIRVGRELGTEIDVGGGGSTDEPAAPPARRRRRVDFG